MVMREFPRAQIVCNTRNVGFARANNQTLQSYGSQARYFLLLNPDTLVAPGVIDELVSYMDRRPEVGISGCKLVKPDGTLDWPCKRSFLTPSMFLYRALGLDTRFPRSPRFGRYQLTYLDEDQIHEVDSVVGAFLLIRAETVQQIGLLDEAFYMYGEDLDWCYRARAAGWKVVYYPHARVVHHKGQSSARRSYRMIYWWYRALWMVYRRHCANRYLFPVNWAVWWGLCGMGLASLTRNVFRKKKGVPSRQ
jgi:GT2 family glycosyltransferase